MVRLSPMRRRFPASRRCGAAAVEFAIVAPLLIMLLFGMIEVGRALMVQQLLANAARDGARSAILEGATAADVEAAVLRYLGESSIAGVTVLVDPNPLTLAQGGDPVRVSVSVPFSSVSWLAPPQFFAGATLGSSVTMRREVFTSTYDESTSGGGG